ncbi:ABC transporter substrate-binding protein [Parapusillimonas granuli]|uniref:ABC transporter substrate-binding protein n=1 Tax=Parapusillimonas granuli TaxID=380911 RepID=A0A853FTK3_9BURK|nr:ABC transporter substrate-binding protein [Parapusillimonas granuli]MBB5214903.1 branched-chain amino acid transport system substrate-binding protein [Parapusillimonas granuli]MEB2401247.1 ABC transporter substrate-binding protein [Alcaligenaceae bacterium]NYT49225.1 ABC transporter substrate-binding protein [Parapusillimonas granuli]
MKSTKIRHCGTVLALALAGMGAAAQAQETLKIGVLATLEGALTVSGQDGMRGMELAMRQHNFTAGGKKIEVIRASSTGQPDTAVNAARKLVEQDKVAILIGPLSGSEGIAVKDYAKTQPNVVFVNGSSAAQETTLKDPASNFYRFSTDGAQWSAGLGSYVYNDKGYKKVAVVAEDYSFPYAQVQGFMIEYCKAGGKVTDKQWVPLGTKDYSSVIAKLPSDVDAIYVALGGSDAVNFFSQYEQSGGNKPFIGGSITVDQTVLSYKGKRRDALVGTPAAGPTADNWDDPEWKKFVQAYRDAKFDNAYPTPGLFAHAYYVNTKAVLTGLDAVNGDVGKLGQQLATMTVQTPTGPVKLDENRNGVANIFLTEVAKGDNGALYNRVVKVTANVTQTLGLSKEEFAKMGFGTRTNPECK